MSEEEASGSEREWWSLLLSEADLSKPGIYEWRIADEYLYIGKSKRLRSRIREYPNNVRKLAIGAPYRKGKPTAYRDIHHALNHARADFLPVAVIILENCDASVLNEREQHWIRVRKEAEIQHGGPRVLNAAKHKS